jgi:hypothetical protein
MQDLGNPDTNGNGIGVKFVPGGINGRDTYVTGLVLPAIAKAAAENPGAIVGAGSQVGRTYAQVVQDTIDYFAYGQNDSGYARGAWRYYANSGDADNSTAQWPVIGMLYGQAVPGVTVPSFVKSELKGWIDYIQNVNGGSGYDVDWNLIVNEAKTGGLLVEMAFTGYNGTSRWCGQERQGGRTGLPQCELEERSRATPGTATLVTPTRCGASTRDWRPPSA